MSYKKHATDAQIYFRFIQRTVFVSEVSCAARCLRCRKISQVSQRSQASQQSGISLGGVLIGDTHASGIP